MMPLDVTPESEEKIGQEICRMADRLSIRLGAKMSKVTHQFVNK
ncbi:MAG: hypothetical protein Q7R66_20260 [Undibacterium sp.]|nr:hypothetical protein [Undibacterium sp.]